MRRYVWRELVRNPRRTAVSLGGVTLGVALFASVLFFVDGSGATMTRRAVAPLALDMQRVVTSLEHSGLTLEERVTPRSLREGAPATVTLTVTNEGAEPANEVVVGDEPPRALVYVPGTTRLHGDVVRDVAGQSPLVGLGGSGLNLGTLAPGASVTLSYRATAGTAVGAVGRLRLRGRVSSREQLEPTAANTPRPLTLAELQARIAAIPGVAAADRLAFVDLPPGSLHARGTVVDGLVRVFAFDPSYLERYPSIRIARGSLEPGGAVLSAEAAHALAASAGENVELTLPARSRRLALPVSGIADLAEARPLFYSRKTRKLEDFLYVANAVIVSPETFESVVVPAFRAAAAVPGAVTRSFPLQEVDVLVDRTRLRSDPATALSQTRVIARAVDRVDPGQGYLIDNISNTLAVAADDAVVGKRMFVFLGLPGILLAAFFAVYAGAVLAAAQRREHATLRIRGAGHRHLTRMLAYRTLALAGTASVLGVVLGLVSATLVLGSGTMSHASAGDLAVSAAISLGVGLLATGLGLYVPGRSSLRREIDQERAELTRPRPSRSSRWGLGAGLLVAALAAEAIALGVGAFDAPGGSVSAGRAVSVPYYLVLAPVVAWFAGALFSIRALETAASRLRGPGGARYGPVLRGTLTRSVARRAGALATSAFGVGLAFAFGTCLAVFGSSYDAAKAADSRFVVGADLRVTPDVTSTLPHGAGFASVLRVPGVAAATPVVFGLENSILIGRYNQRGTDLAAIEPEGFARAAALADSMFVERSAAKALAALAADRDGLLVDAALADDLSIEPGDDVRVQLAGGTPRETRRRFRVVGLIERFPGFPQHVDMVANLSTYAATTGVRNADFFLLRADDPGHTGLARAVAALRRGPGARDPIDIDTTETALDKDQSSLTALNVQGLVDLNLVYTLLLGAAAIWIFVFGLLLQRRRELVTLRALGLHAREVRLLVFGEAALVAAAGVVVGVVVGTGVAYLLVHVLRPLFVLDPEVSFPVTEIALLVLLGMAAALAAALAASEAVRSLSPTELLRES